MVNRWRAALLVALIGVGGLIVAFQGWRGRGPDADVVSAMVRAVALVERGHLPRRGNLTDHNSFRPPGSTWLAVPGVVLFSDPRLVELGGAGLLYLATLPGVFLIGRHYFSMPAALLATVLYACSAIAILLAGNLAPKAYPLFTVWMVYCAGLWVTRRDGRWLAVACFVWIAGMYVHIEMAPFLLILPAVWWRFRPPVSPRALLVTAAFGMLMWTPYFAFQGERRFVDLESQLLLRRIESRGVETVPWCGEDPYPTPRFLARPSIDALMLKERAASIADMTLMNLETRVLGGEFVLLGLLTGGLVTALARHGWRVAWSPAFTSRRMVWSTVLLLMSIVATEFALRWLIEPAGSLAPVLLNLRRLHVWLILVGGVWLAGDPRVAQKAREFRHSWFRGEQASLLAIAIVVPSTVLLAASEAGVNRMLGVWPLQATMIAGFAGACLTGVPGPRWRWLLAPLVVMIVAANLPVLLRLRDWRANGWSGVEPAHVTAADFRLVRCEDERP